LIDSYPVPVWYNLKGKAEGRTAEQISEQLESQISFIDKTAAIWPLFFGTIFMKVAEGPNTFNPADLNYWVRWQLITAKNWFAQSIGFRAQIKECGL